MASGRKGPKRRPARFLRRKTPQGVVFDVVNSSLLFLLCATILYPFWTTLVLSFSGAEEASSLGFRVWIKQWKLTSYGFALSRYGKVSTAYFNSVFRTVVGTVFTVAATLLAAYPLSKRDLPRRNLLTMVVLITMFFSGGLIPTYLLIRNIGLFDTRWALILPVMTMGYYVIIMRNFLMTIDSAYEESAFMDGANYLQILIRIIIPLSKPVIAVVALWSAVLHWNSWFDALIYLRSENKIVLQVLLRRMLQEMEIFGIGNQMETYMELKSVELPSASVKAAITVLTIGPIIMLYPFLQKHFVKGVFMGSLKG